MNPGNIALLNQKLLSTYVIDDFPITKWEWHSDSEKLILADQNFSNLIYSNKQNSLFLNEFIGTIKKEDQLKVLLAFTTSSYEKEPGVLVRFRIEGLNYTYHLIEGFSQLFQEDKKYIIKGFFRDITPFISKLSELDELKDNIEERQNLFPVGYWEVDPLSQKLNWSKELYRIYGLDYGSLIPSTLFFLNKIVHPDDIEKVKYNLQLFYRMKKSFSLNYRIIRTDGSLRNIQARGLIKRNLNGEFLKFMGASVDITEDSEI